MKTNKVKNPEIEEEFDPASQSLTEALTIGLSMLKGLMFLVICTFIILGGFYVDEGTSVLVRRFGEYKKTPEGIVKVYEPGTLYYAIPLIDKKEVINQKARELTFDTEFSPAGGVARTSKAKPKQKLSPAIDGYTITGDMNIIHSKWKLNYWINDPYAFKTRLQDKATKTFNKQTGKEIYRSGPEQLLVETFLNVVVSYTAGTTVDDALKGNLKYVERIKQATIKKLNLYDCGIKITGIQLTKPAAPGITIPAFTDVINAKTEYNKKISTAEGIGREIITNTTGRAKEIVNASEVYKQKVISSARSDADNIKELLAKFKDDEEGLNIYLNQYHSEVISEVLSKYKPFVIRPGATWYVNKHKGKNNFLNENN